MAATLLDRLTTPGPKKILSLDGGGIRGALSLGYLKKIETLLREKEGKPNLVLSDYFDLIGGTSTGAIIATLLALGKSVDDITTMYLELGGEIFAEKRNWWNPLETFKFFKAEFGEKALEQALEKYVGEIALGDDDIKTGLCIVAKRADTNSTWPLINHPNGKYYPQNKEIKLKHALRASSAAPSYFIPQMIDVGKGQIGAFVDGGVSMANNPALTLLMVATLEGFPFRWSMGEENLTIVSVGTGYSIYQKKVDDIDDSWLVTWAKSVPEMLMQDSSWQNQIILQWLSNSPTAVVIDREMGDLKNDFIAAKPLLKYLRYNIAITKENLNNLGLKQTFSDRDVKNIIEMSNAGNRFILRDIGIAAASIIKEEHF